MEVCSTDTEAVSNSDNGDVHAITRSKAIDAVAVAKDEQSIIRNGVITQIHV